MTNHKPAHLEVNRKEGLTITWADGAQSFYPIGHLRRLSPSADQRQLRTEMETNPLTVLPSSSSAGSDQPLTVISAEMVGNYAIRIRFSDGHDTGIYSWGYLREIDPERPSQAGGAPSATDDDQGPAT